jgi:hypothetical protein
MGGGGVPGGGLRVGREVRNVDNRSLDLQPHLQVLGERRYSKPNLLLKEGSKKLRKKASP